MIQFYPPQHGRGPCSEFFSNHFFLTFFWGCRAGYPRFVYYRRGVWVCVGDLRRHHPTTPGWLWGSIIVIHLCVLILQVSSVSRSPQTKAPTQRYLYTWITVLAPASTAPFSIKEWHIRVIPELRDKTMSWVAILWVFILENPNGCLKSFTIKV